MSRCAVLCLASGGKYCPRMATSLTVTFMLVDLLVQTPRARLPKRYGKDPPDARALQDRWRNDQARDSSERTIFANKGQACLRSSLDISCRKGSAGHPHDRPCDPAQGQKGSKSHA